MKIVQLKAENVKRLEAVEITPEGNLVVIGGQNAQGKSSVLDSIYMALAGKKAQGLKPVREGENKAVIECDLGDLKVKRTITPTGGGTLKVMNGDGKAYTGPQEILDALSSKLSFDPLMFSRENAKKQLEILKSMLGVDTHIIDLERQRCYDERTYVNREVTKDKATLDALDYHDDAPEFPVKIGERMAVLQKAEEFNKEQELLEKSIIQMMQRRDNLEEELRTINDTLKTSEDVQPLKDLDVLRQDVRDVETINSKVEDNKRYIEFERSLKKVQTQSKGLTEKIKDLDLKKQSIISEAVFPIDGMAFDENGVLFNDIPFDQCSSAEQLKISLAMGMALNPKLKVLLIRDGSLLDDGNLKLIYDMANEKDVQVWIERVGEDKECSVIIEDGHVKE